MAVKGVFASDSHIVGARKGDFAGSLLQIDPTGSASMLALSAGMESMAATDTVVNWFEENHLSGRVRVTTGGGIDASTTTLPLLDASQIVAGAIMLCEATGEYVFVTAVSGNSLTIQRGFAGSTADAIANSAYLQKIGTAYEEGSSKPTSVANLGYPRYNFLQIFRNAWDVTGTAQAVEYLTGPVKAKNKRECALQHAEDIERSLLWGRKSITVLNNKPFRTMDGILTQITTNVTVETGNTLWDDIDTFLRGIFERNIKGKPNERIAYCGNTVLGVLNKLARLHSTIEIQPGQTEFGLKVNKWMTPYGDISLMTHPLMNESPIWTKDLYVLHPGAIRTRYLRPTHEDNNDRDGTRAGVDADYGTMTSELTVEYRAELTGGKFTNISTAAAA